jgi:pilus assembly protein CpaF
MAGLNIPTKFVRHYISSALDILVHVSRLTDGSRKLVSLQELTGMEGETINLQEIFVFEQTGLDTNGLVKGRFKATGIRPRFVEKLTARGIPVPSELFDPRKSYEV